MYSILESDQILQMVENSNFSEDLRSFLMNWFEFIWY